MPLVVLKTLTMENEAFLKQITVLHDETTFVSTFCAHKKASFHLFPKVNKFTFNEL